MYPSIQETTSLCLSLLFDFHLLNMPFHSAVIGRYVNIDGPLVHCRAGLEVRSSMKQYRLTIYEKRNGIILTFDAHLMRLHRVNGECTELDRAPVLLWIELRGNGTPRVKF